MLTFVTRSDIVVYPFSEFVPVEVSRNQFKAFFLSELSGSLRVVTPFCVLG